MSALAVITPGLSGAELEFVVNEAAIRAVRRVTDQLQKRDDLDVSKVTPVVLPEDFEASVRDFFATRRKKVDFMSLFK